ncbi:hypothetical protein J437_LFUL001639 [Ladona fulva]|uniref:Uncharacterized protein n=1 Tax=Ladona fulva TaxID=123851 RepID=A0A8K0JXH9_LADFU|nr:hypothetical protein J437_LFUL001639 [Ladona fulva]
MCPVLTDGGWRSLRHVVQLNPGVSNTNESIMSKTLNAYRVKKIESIGKMTQMTQEEIMTNTKTVVQGLEALKNEHNSILNGLTSSLEAQAQAQQDKAVEAAAAMVAAVAASAAVVSANSVQAAASPADPANVVLEKTGLVQKSLEMIELGLGEAQLPLFSVLPTTNQSSYIIKK